MVKYENECRDCGLPCIPSCPHKRVPHLYCDRCGEDVAELYRWVNGFEWCADCIMDELEKVTLE